ncbi:MAG: hypothetical protein ABI539_15210 [Acidobacteriota bacterium]
MMNRERCITNSGRSRFEVAGGSAVEVALVFGGHDDLDDIL